MGKVYLADHSKPVGGQRGPKKRHGEDSQGTEEVHLSKGKVKKHKIWDIFQFNPSPLKNDKHNTIRKSNISFYAQTSQQNIKRLLPIFSYFSFSLTSSGRTDKKLEAKFDGPNIKIIPKRKRSIHSKNYSI